MCSLSSQFQAYASKHPKSNPDHVDYGTSGLRARAEILDSIAFRMAIGLMITASHNPAEDNGIKLIDCTGSMLEESWEPICTELANESDEKLEDSVKNLILKMNMKGEGLVLMGMDTRDSSEKLALSAADGVKAMDTCVRDLGLLTTPQLHYIVYAYNKSLGEPTESGYFTKFSGAFANLCASLKSTVKSYKPLLNIDCANGVGGIKMKLMKSLLEPYLTINIHNSGNGVVNHKCGSFYVETDMKEPIGCSCKPGERWASFDGDVDRIIYYYKRGDDNGALRICNGDKIAALFCLYVKGLLSDCKLEDKLTIQVVQTAYSNGKTTQFLRNTVGVNVEYTATGVKHLMRKAADCDISIFFESNGHGSILYNDKAYNLVQNTVRTDSTGSAKLLLQVFDLMNQATGDAISDFLLVEAILRAKDWNIEDWDAIYETSPSRLLKLIVPDRKFLKTNDIATVVLEPAGLQDDLNQMIATFGEDSRVIVRPSGTEDLVRVYAESKTQEKADQLAEKVRELVEKYSKNRKID
uniref:phosphoacetylglucosamine mutase n=1 Tax=Tetranychus urticae TaxID=32264 RepID=T1K323_TETUR